MKLFLFMLITIFPITQQDNYLVKSEMIRLNGASVQMHYVVRDIDQNGSAKSVQLISKKLVDTKTGTELCALRIYLEDERDPVLKLSQIDKTKLDADTFADVNFDGYLDILQPCDICSGSTNSIVDIYLFNPASKKYNYWISGSNMDMDNEAKAVSFQDNNDAKQFNYLQFKFDSKGSELYRETISCKMVRPDRSLYRLVYNRYTGKKIMAHKITFIKNDQIADPWPIIDKLRK